MMNESLTTTIDASRITVTAGSFILYSHTYIIIISSSSSSIVVVFIIIIFLWIMIMIIMIMIIVIVVVVVVVFEWYHFQCPGTTSNQDFKVKTLFYAEYLRNGTRYRHGYNEILIATYTCPTQGCHFEWLWVTLSDLAKYSRTWSIARPVCGSWASCFILAVHSTFSSHKLELCGYRWRKMFVYVFIRFYRIPACDRRTDRQTSCISIVRARWNGLELLLRNSQSMDSGPAIALLKFGPKWLYVLWLRENWNS